MSYQRYSTNKAGRRFKPKELRSYQDVVATTALAAGFRPGEWNLPMRVDLVFVLEPQGVVERRLAKKMPFAGRPAERTSTT
ncbi:MAG: hypothetical protein HC923_12965 [Myxococcales bacterium]|nr:hypothetical protein [Myxococcales bacterium]